MRNRYMNVDVFLSRGLKQITQVKILPKKPNINKKSDMTPNILLRMVKFIILWINILQKCINFILFEFYQ